MGDFYEAHGLSGVMLVEHANLNPMGGWTTRAGTPLPNIQKVSLHARCVAVITLGLALCKQSAVACERLGLV